MTLGFHELETKYALSVQQTHKLEVENRQLLEANDLFRQELQENQDALAKAAIAYSALKSQYEELLLRVTELHRENSANQSPEQPADSAADTQVITQLRSEIERLSIRKADYKSEASQLSTKVDRLRHRLAHLKSRFRGIAVQFCQEFIGIVGPVVKVENDHPDFDCILKTGHELVYMIGNSVPIVRYNRLKAKSDALRMRCAELVASLQESRRLLEVHVTNRDSRERSGLEEELKKMETFLDRYARSCAAIGIP
jgi:DNA repair exonuclease SbcCD ATPase subunit